MAQYYVRYTARAAKGSRATYGPYSLSAAKDQTRISSQHGSPAEVWRGSPRAKGSKRVRRYAKGKRTFPVTATQLKGLTHGELPNTLKGRRNPSEDLIIFVLGGERDSVWASPKSLWMDEELLARGINMGNMQLSYDDVDSFLEDMLRELTLKQSRAKTAAVWKALDAHKSVQITTSLSNIVALMKEAQP